MNIGAKIKKLRNLNGLTQYQLAEYMNVSMQTVSRWETSTTYPDIVLLPILAKLFNVTTDYLLSDGENFMKTIKSDKLCIRDWNENDALALCELSLKAEHLIFNNVNDSLEAIKIWKEHQEIYPVFMKETEKLIGIVGLVDVNRYNGYRELEVSICDEYCVESYVTELYKLILNYAFKDLDIIIVFSLCSNNEEALIQAMKNIGFVCEGTLRKFGRDMGDRIRYSITKDEYFAL